MHILHVTIPNHRLALCLRPTWRESWQSIDVPTSYARFTRSNASTEVQGILRPCTGRSSCIESLTVEVVRGLSYLHCRGVYSYWPHFLENVLVLWRAIPKGKCGKNDIRGLGNWGDSSSGQTQNTLEIKYGHRKLPPVSPILLRKPLNHQMSEWLLRWSAKIVF